MDGDPPEMSLSELAAAGRAHLEAAEESWGATGRPGTLDDFIGLAGDLADVRARIRTTLAVLKMAPLAAANASTHAHMVEAEQRLRHADAAVVEALRVNSMTSPDDEGAPHGRD